ncbi:MAG TPA: hypothetical protein VH475_20500 [Tepidisphaeraceae bacterium]|jgi:hypothetical protein
MAQNAPNDSFWNWLGRQFGHVRKAVKTDVTKPPAALPPQQQQDQGAKPQAAQQQQPPPPPPPPETHNIIYRDAKAEEVELPDRPGVKLRRTVIDEVIVEEKKGESRQ